jgi:predicted amidohydrolase
VADLGAEFMINCAAWPFPRVEHWTILNQARAIENLCYVISCGCAGACEGKLLIGHSMVIDPWGTVIGCAAERENVFKVELDPAKVTEIRNEFPALRDRQIKI